MTYRDRIVNAMTKKKLFPADYSVYPDEDVTGTLADGGLYPDIEDPKFVARLLKKSEFADTISRRETKTNPCEMGPGFEVTPVQRFVANFLHPRTPYMSMLLYHSVGVGKTCAAIQTAEAYLDVYPRRRVLIVVPRNIRSGFNRTIFDIENLTIGTGNSPNSAVGCTGDTYLKLTGCLFERDKELIEKRITRAINQRYAFFGYGQFRNYIRNVVKKVPLGQNETENELRITTALKNEFNYRLLIIDEAHNLRDVAGSSMTFSAAAANENNTDESAAEAENIEDEEESKAGKELTPYLKQLLRSSDGMKLLLMTATPMFNSVFEIVFLLNLMLMNDKKAEVRTDMLLDVKGRIAGDPARRLFRRIANAYISFMRGENPDSFPVRLFPEGELRDGEDILRITASNYPQFEMANEKGSTESKVVSRDDRIGMSKLPLVKSYGTAGETFDTLLRKITAKKVAEGGTGYQVVDSLLQAGNCMFPVDDEDPESSEPDIFFGSRGFERTFEPVSGGKGILRSKGDAEWLSLDSFGNYSPKGAMILNSVRNAEGVCFIYSRFVKVGALLLALAFEANGYTPYGRDRGFLADGIQSEGGRQCALCDKREASHAGEAHDFKPAKYVLLTGDKTLSPNVAEAIKVARGAKNVNGELVKVVIGSQIAAEGLDLRFVREVHIFDAWFHLNKTEQIIGRGIRFCSHSLIEPASKRNTTVFLHVTTFADDKGYKETADLYCYRKALEKAILTGQVSRELKIGAIDCNLRKDVTVISGLKNRIMMDSQGHVRKGSDPLNPGISVNDTDFTTMCDWMSCSYICDPTITVDPKTADESTYDIFSARFRETQIQREIQKLFAEQPFFEKGEFFQQLGLRILAPQAAILMTIQGIINNRTFRVKSGAREGYVVYKNGFFLFQPDAYKDTSIPLALRIAEWPIKVDEYEPASIKKDIQPIIKPAVVKAQQPTEEETLEEIQPRNEFWKSLVKWVNDLVEGRSTSVRGTEIERSIEKYVDLKEERSLYIDKLYGILFVNARVTDKTAFKQAVLEFFWDEWIHPKEQVRMLLDNVAGTTEVASEQLMKDGAIRAIRHINAENNSLEFTCEGGNTCSRLIVDAFMSRSDAADPVKTSSADDDHAGILYGFMVPKRGIMVFKTHKPHEVGEKVDVRFGQECGIVTATSQYFDNLVSIGTYLSRIGVPNLDLTSKMLRSSGEVTNFKRGCAVLDIVLRYLDNKKVDRKKWFFRPVAAYYSGHRGKVSAEAKMAEQAAAKQLKKQEAELKKQQYKREAELKKGVKKKVVVMAAEEPAVAAPKPATIKRRVIVASPKVVKEDSESENENENEASTAAAPAAAPAPAPVPAALPMAEEDSGESLDEEEKLPSPKPAAPVPAPVPAALPMAEEDSGESLNEEKKSSPCKKATPIISAENSGELLEENSGELLEENESVDEEQLAREEAERAAAEQRAREEAERAAAEQRAREEAERAAAEQRTREEAERAAAEQRTREATVAPAVAPPPVAKPGPRKMPPLFAKGKPAVVRQAAENNEE
jgi:hypothetical protein